MELKSSVCVFVCYFHYITLRFRDIMILNWLFDIWDEFSHFVFSSKHTQKPTMMENLIKKVLLLCVYICVDANANRQWS